MRCVLLLKRLKSVSTPTIRTGKGNARNIFLCQIGYNVIACSKTPGKDDVEFEKDRVAQT